MPNSYNVIVVTAFSSNQNSPQLFANTGMNGNNSALIGAVLRYQGGLSQSTMNQIGQYFFLAPVNQKTTIPSQGKTSYPRFP